MISSLMMIVPIVMPAPKPLLSINRSRINHLARFRPPSELQWCLLEKLELIITQRRPGSNQDVPIVESGAEVVLE